MTNDYYVITNQIKRMNKMVVMEQESSSMHKTKVTSDLLGGLVPVSTTKTLIMYTKTNAQVSYDLNKMEMEVFCAKEQSWSEHLFMIAVEEYIMNALELPYRVLRKCTFDIGRPNASGVDIEAWMPGQNDGKGAYRETHTADFIGDFQTRAMKTRVRRADGTVELANTNDATASSERPLIAIIENNQTAEGNVVIPKVLRQFMGGAEEI